MTDSFKARTTLAVNGRQHTIWSLAALPADKVARLPYSLKILLENLLRFEDGVNVTRADIEALLDWDAKAAPSYEISFTPARVIMQDFTGVPCVVDLAAMREAIAKLGGDPDKVNPLAPAELVIDHSVQVDEYGTAQALADNNRIEFERNGERYSFLRWGQTAFRNFKVVPPNTGIVHQVNLEFLGRVVFAKEGAAAEAYPDTVVGTDSHTTMINGLGVLGWGVGGIEAEAAMLGQPVTMLIPQVIGFKLIGQLPPGATATDLVLTVTEMLRKKGVVDKFVEFFGDGLANLPLADRATIGNMSPEFGSTCAIFPIDEETIRYLKLSGRPDEQIALVEAYAKAQGMWRVNGQKAGRLHRRARTGPGHGGTQPRRAQPAAGSRAAAHRQDRVPDAIASSRPRSARRRIPTATGKAAVDDGWQELRSARWRGADRRHHQLHQHLQSLRADGRGPGGAQCAHAAGLNSKPWVKTSLAPGSRVVTDYLAAAGLLDELAGIGFNLVGYGCTTCIGNSGPLRPEISAGVKAGDVIGCSVLSGNRNFDGRVHPEVKQNYLASPPLVVAYALAGTLDVDLNTEPLGTGTRRQARVPQGHLAQRRAKWPTACTSSSPPRCSRAATPACSTATSAGAPSRCPPARSTPGTQSSTYVKNPPYFDGMTMTPDGCGRHPPGARAGVAGRFGDHRPHLPGRQHRQEQPGGALPGWNRACSPWTSTSTARGAAITK